MSFLFDSNACIAAIRGRPAAVRERALLAEAADRRIFVSSVAVFELWHGVAYSNRVEENTLRLSTFLETVTSLHFDDDDAREAGMLRADLRKQGLEIGPYDCLIAAQAMRRNLVLVTANIREFSRVPGLRWENWEEA